MVDIKLITNVTKVNTLNPFAYGQLELRTRAGQRLKFGVRTRDLCYERLVGKLKHVTYGLGVRDQDEMVDLGNGSTSRADGVENYRQLLDEPLTTPLRLLFPATITYSP